MSLVSLVAIEFRKIKRSKILLILLSATIILWIPSVVNAEMNFHMQDVGISPEHNFFIQGFLGMAWFLFPASMVVSTVLLSQTERTNHGLLKMLALPIPAYQLCLGKFFVLLTLAAAQIFMVVGAYYLSAAIASLLQHYPFALSPVYLSKEALLLWLAAIPMLSFFWMLSVCIPTPIFSIELGLASVVPSVLMINTRFWFLYPMSYPFYGIVSEYGRLAEYMDAEPIAFFPWVPTAAAITILCLVVSCLRFGQAERR